MLWDLGQGLWEGKSLRERAHRECVVSLLLCFPSNGRNLYRRRSLIANEATSLKAKAAYDDFLALRKDADPNVSLLVQAKSKYAKLQ